MYIHKILIIGLFSTALTMTGVHVASAAQDRPILEHGVTAVCTGVGSSKADSRWSSYPVKLVFANTKGQYVADEHITLSEGDHTVMQTDCDAPWLLLRAPAGHYTVSASLIDANGTRRVDGQFSAAPSGQGQKILTLEFPVATQGVGS